MQFEHLSRSKEKCCVVYVVIALLLHPLLVNSKAYFVERFNIYIEERLSKDAQPFEEFGRRLLSSQPQLDPVLTVYAEVLHAMWKFYDPMIAALMFNSSLQFIAFSCLEPQIEKIQLIPEGDRFAWFIRDATGIPGYGLLNFTKEENFTAMDIIQALPYFSFWFSAVNDILS